MGIMSPKHCTSLVMIILLSACATTDYRIVGSRTGEAMSLASLASALADQDVVFLAEEHDNEMAHQAHLELVKELHQQGAHVVVSLEMFERDVQDELMLYLAGFIDEREFLSKARPWPNYEEDYRPLVEYARAEGLMVLAANAPRPLAQLVSAEGLESVAGRPHVAREVSTPRDRYWELFKEAMGEHGGVGGEEDMFRYYEAQCLKDDTMAESIVDYLVKVRQTGGNALVVHVNGRMHSDGGLGTVARVRLRDPLLKIALVGMESVDDVARARVVTPSIGDYVLLVKAQPPELRVVAPGIAMQESPMQRTPMHETPGQESVVEELGSNAGGTPALGFAPDYEYQGRGLRAGEVTAGGPSATAGLQAGDVVVEVNGIPVEDIYTYMDAMDTLAVGSRVTVVVRRVGETVNLSVVVGSR